MGAYSTTLEEDEEEEKEREPTELSVGANLGIRYRMIEKAILNSNAQMIQSRLEALQQ